MDIYYPKQKSHLMAHPMVPLHIPVTRKAAVLTRRLMLPQNILKEEGVEETTVKNVVCRDHQGHKVPQEDPESLVSRELLDYQEILENRLSSHVNQ